jgi:hypothetical protein
MLVQRQNSHDDNLDHLFEGQRKHESKLDRLFELQDKNEVALTQLMESVNSLARIHEQRLTNLEDLQEIRTLP